MLPTEEFGGIHANCRNFPNWTVKHATVCGFDSGKISETVRANVTARCWQMDPSSHLLVMITSRVAYLCMAAHPASPALQEEYSHRIIILFIITICAIKREFAHSLSHH